jgi:hypothetical protein
MQTQLKEGKTAPPAASNKRNFQALQDVGEAPAASKKRVTTSSSSSVGCDISPTVLQMLPASSSYSHESRFSNQSPATFIMQQQASPIVHLPEEFTSLIINHQLTVEDTRHTFISQRVLNILPDMRTSVRILSTVIP